VKGQQMKPVRSEKDSSQMVRTGFLTFVVATSLLGVHHEFLKIMETPYSKQRSTSFSRASGDLLSRSKENVAQMVDSIQSLVPSTPTCEPNPSAQSFAVALLCD
jgi:hypothetical protein